MARLGFFYEHGYGSCAVDFTQATSWYRAAAAEGQTKGSVGLGYCILEGKVRFIALSWWKLLIGGPFWVVEPVGCRYTMLCVEQLNRVEDCRFE